MGWWDTDTQDMSTDAIDAGTQGDAPQNDSTGSSDWGSIPDYGSLPIGAMIPNINLGSGGGGGGAMVTQAQWQVPAARAAIAAGRYMSGLVASAITKLSQRLGGASTSIAGYGRKVWSQLSDWSAKNPGVSLVATLTSLGLTVEEAAHFVAWGATHKKKRRSRGVSGRDIRICRRTIRKLVSMTHLLAQLRGGHHRHSYGGIPRHRHRVVSFRKR